MRVTSTTGIRAGGLGEHVGDLRGDVTGAETGDHEAVGDRRGGAVAAGVVAEDGREQVDVHRDLRGRGHGAAAAGPTPADHDLALVERGPAARARPTTKAPVALLCRLRTRRAACTTSSSTTSAPRSRQARVAAAVTAATRLAGPSAPGVAGVRIAPVRTRGSGRSHSRSRTYAVSSRVSVPCTTTTPDGTLVDGAPGQRQHLEQQVEGDPGRADLGQVHTLRSIGPSAPGRSPGASPATSSAASRAGVAPWPPSAVMLIVPPRKYAVTRRRAPAAALGGVHGSQATEPTAADRRAVSSSDPASSPRGAGRGDARRRAGSSARPRAARSRAR